MNLTTSLNTTIATCLSTFDAILTIYNTAFEPTIAYKPDSSPLTEADMRSNQIICDSIKSAYPGMCILSEETTADEQFTDSEYCWVVDPLDGTKEFISRNGQFTVNIALTQNHRAILGVVGIPISGLIYYATKGGGAFRRDENGISRINVSDKTSDLIWVGSRSHSSEKEERLIQVNRHLIRDTLSVGSSIKGLMVAEGKADVYYRFGPTCEWDTCAMQCIVEEAGGILRQMDSTEMLYNRENHLNEKGFFVVNRKENIWV